ncbi:sulfatase-like hydrolase/transferase [Maribacter sp. 2307ULW6-5]|uniref:sulfatase-like hydrolase/transferase n=1 Tax=Maribacter sp. 2307ULW6-5 TaxID=3386275 RepID=UPI0039BD695F
MSFSGLRILVLVVVLALSACKERSTVNETRAEKPNIIFLFTDDQTFASINALGNLEIQTPNLDRMVRNGTTFTHAYNMGGWHGAICVASRAMIISGAYLWNARDKAKRWAARDSLAMQRTWPKLLEQQGYDTYMSGKWHVEAPAEMLFSRTAHVRPGMPPDRRGQLPAAFQKWEEESGDMKDWNEYLPLEYARPVDVNDTLWHPADSLQGGFWEGGTHWSEVVRNDALDFLAEASSKEAPFFMYLAFNAPHDPRQAPQEFLDLYPLDSVALPKNFLPEYPYRYDMGNAPTLRDEALAPFPRTEHAVKKHRQEYYAIISHLDAQIGKILDAVEASGKAENTYIFFGSDHGLSVGQHGLLGKQSLFDHSVRVPLIVMGPGVRKDVRVPHDVYLQDVMATSLDLAGVEKPDFVQFNSFGPLLRGEDWKTPYNGVYGAYMHLQRMMRKDGYKLLIYPKIGKILLFDLQADPNEMNNLAAMPEHRERVGSLFKDLMEMQKTMNDTLNLQPLFTQWDKEVQ